MDVPLRAAERLGPGRLQQLRLAEVTTVQVLALLAPLVFAGVGWWIHPDARAWRRHRRRLRAARANKPRSQA
ncbi:hypothetical protein GCM10010193_69710 [Kitasatospora atroaurantiaca]